MHKFTAEKINWWWYYPFGKEKYAHQNNYDNEFLTKVQQDFKIPFAGSRASDSLEIGVVGTYAFLWSSSPTIGFLINESLIRLLKNKANATLQ